MRQMRNLLLAISMTLTLCACQPTIKPNQPETVAIKLLATSDLHGKMLDWNYRMNQEVPAGSLARVSTAIQQLRDENTIVIDAGDTVQGNCAELFHDEPIHPMMQCLNQIGYDIWVTGNHEYDYGGPKVQDFISSFDGTSLTGNVFDPDGNPIADAYTVIEKSGVRIGLIGMTTPVIADLSTMKNSGYVVKDPIEETARAIEALQGKVDVLVAVCHMGTVHSISDKDTTVYELADACPELDVIIGAHEHRTIEEEFRNGILIVENKDMAETMSDITLIFSNEDGAWSLRDKHARTIYAKDYDPDPKIEALVADYDAKIKSYMAAPAGRVYWTSEDQLYGPLFSSLKRSEEEILAKQVLIPEGSVRDHAICDLLLWTIKYYSQADIVGLPSPWTLPPMEEGDITRNQLYALDMYNNTIKTYSMTGAQLKTYLEWVGAKYQKMETDTDPIKFDEAAKSHYVDVFCGIDYKINLAKEAGNRIEQLEYNGKPVEPDDTFVVAVNSFRANNAISSETGIYAGLEIPQLLEDQVRPDIGGIQDMLYEYIEVENNGRIEYSCDGNWELIFEP